MITGGAAVDGIKVEGGGTKAPVGGGAKAWMACGGSGGAVGRAIPAVGRTGGAAGRKLGTEAPPIIGGGKDEEAPMGGKAAPNMGFSEGGGPMGGLKGTDEPMEGLTKDGGPVGGFMEEGIIKVGITEGIINGAPKPLAGGLLTGGCITGGLFNVVGGNIAGLKDGGPKGGVMDGVGFGVVFSEAVCDMLGLTEGDILEDGAYGGFNDDVELPSLAGTIFGSAGEPAIFNSN